jgi:hypothetical protein
MDRTIISGTIEFLDKGVALIHSIDEVYSAGSIEEQDALEDMCYNSGADWVVVEEYLGTFEITHKGLLSILGKISGEQQEEEQNQIN